MNDELPDDPFKKIKWKLHIPDKDILSNKEAAEFLKISLPELTKIRNRGEIPFHIHGGMYFYKSVDCAQWIKENQPERIIRK